MKNQRETTMAIESNKEANGELIAQLAHAAVVESKRELTEDEVLAVSGGSLNTPLSN